MKPNNVMLDKRKERSWNKLKGDISQIIHWDEETQTRMRVNYIKHYQKRVAFIDSLRDQGYTGKAYSDKVVEFDKLTA